MTGEYKGVMTQAGGGINNLNARGFSPSACAEIPLAWLATLAQSKALPALGKVDAQAMFGLIIIAQRKTGGAQLQILPANGCRLNDGSPSALSYLNPLLFTYFRANEQGGLCRICTNYGSPVCRLLPQCRMIS